MYFLSLEEYIDMYVMAIIKVMISFCVRVGNQKCYVLP